mmetsp:Transcript_21037/g.50741  ORF Transcript_21037/g.50741 Transcript_21037/m.50741 type:complete len:110 (-) Transcript_21037:215-544(-)
MEERGARVQHYQGCGVDRAGRGVVRGLAGYLFVEEICPFGAEEDAEAVGHAVHHLRLVCMHGYPSGKIIFPSKSITIFAASFVPDNRSSSPPEVPSSRSAIRFRASSMA